MPGREFVLASGGLHATNPLVSAWSYELEARGGSITLTLHHDSEGTVCL